MWIDSQAIFLQFIIWKEIEKHLRNTKCSNIYFVVTGNTFNTIVLYLCYCKYTYYVYICIIEELLSIMLRYGLRK